jgi:dienelactone hydrolase
MPEPIADTLAYNEFIASYGKQLREGDAALTSPADWMRRREGLRNAMFTAMGSFPKQPCPLEPKILGTIKRADYEIEKLVFQSQPNVWVTANLYRPTNVAGQRPAVLCVHGHWPMARRDPVVQARCLGLVQLGFIVLAIDAFGSGERYNEPAKGTYHGALYGSTLWPVGQTLLGMQVYDNRRAVDYLQTRHEVLKSLLGITGASGGGNQTMYAGALDERFGAAVPVCSVGNYQAYLKAACCVCEVLPGALRFTDEGDVLGLVAPRALMVINASRDAYQFSPAQAEISVDRARKIFQMSAAGDKIKHVIFESGHDYSKPMREAMYGWMVKWLKKEGDGKPIAEPELALETPEDLACFPNPDDRPKGMLFPPSFAAQEARILIDKANKLLPTHAEEWESSAVHMRTQLRTLLGEFPKVPRMLAKLDRPVTKDGLDRINMRLAGEGGIPLPMILLSKSGPARNQPTCLLLDLNGKAAAEKHPVAKILANRGWLVAMPDLRATGETAPHNDAVRGAPDHNSAEHGLWVGRPLLGQWVFDVQCLLDWLLQQPDRDLKRTAVVGLGQAGLVATVAGALMPERIISVGTIRSRVSLVTDQPYEDGFHMGLLVPGLFQVGDVPHLSAMNAPRRLVIVEGVQQEKKRIPDAQFRAAMAFPQGVYKACNAVDRFALLSDVAMDDVVAKL